MRARRGVIVGWLLVGCYTAALVAATVTTHDAALRPGERPDGGAAAADFISAWERSREATFVRAGTFERRSRVTGSVISSADLLVQRPPRRLHRQLGGVEGRDDRRTIACPSTPSGGTGRCTVGPATGPSYAEDVAQEVAALHTLFDGDDPVYAVEEGSEPGCFDLLQQRVEPSARFGREARFCFDRDTGAPSNSRVVYAEGIVEVVAVTAIRGEVTDADLTP